MNVAEEKLQKAISITLSAGYQLDKEAFQFLNDLAQTEDPLTIIESAIKKLESLPEKPLFIGKSHLEDAAKELSKKTTFIMPLLEQEPEIQESKRTFHPYAKDVEPELKIIEDPTTKICTTGAIEEYTQYFRNRFEKLQKLLKQRMDTRDAVTIKATYKAPPNSKLKTIGMISEKREINNKIILRIEDPETSATVLVPKNAPPELQEKAHLLLLDQVICICCIKGKNNLLIAEDFIWPDIPQKTPQKATSHVSAALISDLHIGSKLFMREAFSRFIQWLNGKYGNEQLRELASHVKYVVIAGDIVDGIGIYPKQLNELEIKDITKQYEAAARYIEQIPEYIEVIIIPGNHDATRKAHPQPAIPKEYAEALYETRKIWSLGNPSRISLHNVEILLYHGRSLDDVVGLVPSITYDLPDKAMKLFLQCRHLAPIYGGKTPIAPEQQDFLVIENPPTIFHAGHVHVIKHDYYKGTLLVNSGAWQTQTEFMQKLGLTPIPGIAPIVNLQNLQVTPISFV
ncbi:MAG: DNA-directed DNA polymerase II small subunit [Candidatus Bathyarchaeia archaeon]|jgi:DNA polymerase II small subunit|nr:DNA-directed DNA polymerase II small subunit [Candidatus Bathyarchaeota archaeon A05DMB-4]MDH7595889.1 DNA-directed DNA polymerase II small subunit [Candidatus Bathyarchaeota archaeon]